MEFEFDVMKKADIVREFIRRGKLANEDRTSVFRKVSEQLGMRQELSRTYVFRNWNKVKIDSPLVSE